MDPGITGESFRISGHGWSGMVFKGHG